MTVPRSREGGSPADVMGRYQRRSEEVDAMMVEAYVSGVPRFAWPPRFQGHYHSLPFSLAVPTPFVSWASRWALRNRRTAGRSSSSNSWSVVSAASSS